MDFDDFDDGFVRPPRPPLRGSCQHDPRPTRGRRDGLDERMNLAYDHLMTIHPMRRNSIIAALAFYRGRTYISHRPTLAFRARSISHGCRVRALPASFRMHSTPREPRSRWSRAPARVGHLGFGLHRCECLCERADGRRFMAAACRTMRRSRCWTKWRRPEQTPSRLRHHLCTTHPQKW